MPASSSEQVNYYHKLDELFAIATATVIALCLLALPIIPLDPLARWRFAVVLAVSTLLFLVRYIWLKARLGLDARYYFTNIVNAFMIGSLIYLSGHFGLYLYFMFFLILTSSIAVLRFRHVLVTAMIVGAFSIYFFFLSDTFMLGDSERFLAGAIVLTVLALSTIFTYELIHELVVQLTDLERRRLTFIQDVSHELRTPLTVIKASAGLLKDPRWSRRNAKQQPTQEVVEHLQSATADLEQITEKLSASTKKKANK